VESWVDYVDNNEARMDRDAQAFTFGGRVKYNSYLLLPLSILGIGSGRHRCGGWMKMMGWEKQKQKGEK
jgi:hypothetical protein